jgi:nicotinate-nucleotide adenylyltransferase
LGEDTAVRASQRVGLLGGSFNPPHVCHLLASIYLLETTDLDAIRWVPVHRHAFAKDQGLASWDHRLAMCRAVAAEHPGISVDPIECTLGPTSYTIDTLTALHSAHPGVTFSWIVGADILPELHRWHRWHELREMVQFVVLGRGAPTDPALLPPGGRFVLRDFHLPDVSSSQVRAAKRAGESVDALVPAAIRRYLQENPELYG